MFGSDCMLMEIAEVLNITWRPLQGPSWPDLHKSMFCDISLYEERVTMIQPFMHVLVVNIRPYRFLIVLDKTFIFNSNINSLLATMDRPTWISTLVSILVLTIAFEVHQWRAKLNCVLVLNLFGTLLGQGFNLTRDGPR